MTQRIQLFALKPDATQCTVVFPADQIHLKRDHIARDMIFLQNTGKNLYGRLKLFRYDLIGPKPVEMINLRHIAGPNDNVEVGP